MKDWQFDVLFIVGVGGALVLLIGPSFGLKTGDNPLTVGGVGTILAYVLTQKQGATRNKPDKSEKEVDDGST